MNEFLDKKKLKQYYENIVEERFEWIKRDRPSHVRHLKVAHKARTFIEKAGQKIVVLDVGVGFGEVLAFLKDLRCYRVACDISGRALEIAKKRVDDVIECDAEKLPIRDDSVDLLLCVEVLEHLINPRDLLNEIRRILHPRGGFILTTPNADSKYYKHDKEHLIHFNRETLTRLIGESGLGVTSISSIKIRHRVWLIPLLSYEESILVEGKKNS
jgi:ubiquinone/menaquinone biosynthesis C-methylase UbiE